MADYTLEGPKWGSGSLGTGGGLVTWALGASVPTFADAALSAALTDYAEFANIQFQQVASTAAADISFSFAPIDGLDRVLGDTDFDASGSSFTSASVEFDTGENWHPSGTGVSSSDGTNFFVVALHEIGHALGLDHYNAAPAAMNAVIDLDLSDLTLSDIHGVQALYGVAGGNLFGATVHDVSGFGGEVYALYDGLLDRTPDALGLETYVDALYSGASLHDVAAGILASPEGQSHLGAADNAAFVQQLYHTALHRSADPGGLTTYVDALNNGASRADVAIDIALSTENVNGLQGALQAGVFVPDANAAGVARLYYGVLGRAPDSGGLTTYTAAVDAGTSLKDVARAFLGSTEYQSGHGGATSTQFVQSLYQGALGRPADAGGLQTYVNALNQGTSRATVAVQIAESPEARNHLLPVVEKGFQLA